MTGCGCVLLVAILIGGIVFMIFGSTDPGAPIEQMVGVGSVLALLGAPLMPLLGVMLSPLRRGFVRLRRA